MTRALIINDEIVKQLLELKAKASQHPISWDILQKHAFADQGKRKVELSDRVVPPDKSDRPASFTLDIPQGYTVALTYEEQPVGLLAHVSVSVETEGRAPSPEAMKMITDALGYEAWDKVWLEEFRPGHYAVNVISIVEIAPEMLKPC